MSIFMEALFDELEKIAAVTSTSHPLAGKGKKAEQALGGAKGGEMWKTLRGAGKGLSRASSKVWEEGLKPFGRHLAKSKGLVAATAMVPLSIYAMNRALAKNQQEARRRY